MNGSYEFGRGPLVTLAMCYVVLALALGGCSGEAPPDEGGDTSSAPVAPAPKPKPVPDVPADGPKEITSIRPPAKSNGSNGVRTPAAVDNGSYKKARPDAGFWDNTASKDVADMAHVGARDDVAAPSAARLDAYKVELGAKSPLQHPGPAGELRVWIGAPGATAAIPKDWPSAAAVVEAAGETARVSAYAPAFDISPDSSICLKISPQGSTARFTLTPREAGTFDVGADVLLYASNDCTGTPVSKPATSLQVEVVVNTRGLIVDHLLELWDILWQGVLDFWGWLVAAGFGLAAFLLRKRLMKLFGYDPGV